MEVSCKLFIIRHQSALALDSVKGVLYCHQIQMEAVKQCFIVVPLIINIFLKLSNLSKLKIFLSYHAGKMF